MGSRFSKFICFVLLFLNSFLNLHATCMAAVDQSVLVLVSESRSLNEVGAGPQPLPAFNLKVAGQYIHAFQLRTTTQIQSVSMGLESPGSSLISYDFFPGKITARHQFKPIDFDQNLFRFGWGQLEDKYIFLILMRSSKSEEWQVWKKFSQPLRKDSFYEGWDTKVFKNKIAKTISLRPTSYIFSLNPEFESSENPQVWESWYRTENGLVAKLERPIQRGVCNICSHIYLDRGEVDIDSKEAVFGLAMFGYEFRGTFRRGQQRPDEVFHYVATRSPNGKIEVQIKGSRSHGAIARISYDLSHPSVQFMSSLGGQELALKAQPIIDPIPLKYGPRLWTSEDTYERFHRGRLKFAKACGSGLSPKE